MSEQNEHLKHIADELEEIEAGISKYLLDKYPAGVHRIKSPLFAISNKVQRLEEYVQKLELQGQEHGQALVRLCSDCRREEANPGLEVCGPCYSRRINDHS